MAILKSSTYLTLIVSCWMPFLVSSDKIVLDSHSGQTKEWLEVSCIYNDDYNDFWVFGCPVNLSPEDDVFPSRSGFWSPCSAHKCEIQYFGGAGMPQAKSLTLSMYVKGKPEVLVSSKYSPLDEEFANELGTISDKDGSGWVDVTIDLTNQNRALVLNFTLLSSGDDVLLLDKITVDLGDDVTTTTEPPPPTTSRPIDNDIVTLDQAKDYWLLWDVECTYVEDYLDFWVYGCPSNPREEQSLWPSQGGYWNPCVMRPSCRMRYLGNAQDSPIDYEAYAFKIYGYLDGDANINVTVQEDLEDVDCSKCKIVQIISATPETDGKWQETTVEIHANNPITHYVNIDLAPGNGGHALIEKVEVLIRQRPTTVPTVPTSPTDSTTPNDPTGPTTGESSPQTTTTDPNSGGLCKIEKSLAILTITMSLLYMSGYQALF